MAFSFLMKKTNSELESLVMQVESNMSNNYKDAAQEAFKELEAKAAQLDESGKLNEKQLAYYRTVVDQYRIRLKNFTHKDQKPYWT